MIIDKGLFNKKSRNTLKELRMARRVEITVNVVEIKYDGSHTEVPF